MSYNTLMWPLIFVTLYVNMHFKINLQQLYVAKDSKPRNIKEIFFLSCRLHLRNVEVSSGGRVSRRRKKNLNVQPLTNKNAGTVLF